MSDHGYKRHPSGKILTSGEKQIVLNVFHKLMEHYEDIAVKDILKLTSEYTGISENSVAKVRREFKITGDVKTPIKTRQRSSKTVLEKDECKIKLENEVLELEKTVTELEIKLQKEIESSQTGIESPSATPLARPKLQQSTTDPLEKFAYKEPKMISTSLEHSAVPFTDYKKQAVKRKQTDAITSLNPKVPLSAHSQESGTFILGL